MGILDNKVAIITGGATGIGRGIGQAYAREGATLILASRSKDNLERTAGEFRSLFSATVSVIPADVTVEVQVKALFDKTVEEYGRVDILVNNAGTGIYAPLDVLSLDEWNRVLEVNLTGPFLCTREALKIMKRQHGGRIINIGSISAYKPRIEQGVYSASKAGLLSLTRSTALEGRQYGVSASCLHPGLVGASPGSSFVGANIEPGEPYIEPKDIAAVAVTMASLPPDTNMFEATVLPTRQQYIGRG